tara:strand:- start:2 stop:412 length:411 start_codon:yes stop_codon:yes gene_type:complete
MKIIVNCVDDLMLASNKLVKSFKDKKVICFYGDMGVGKTTLIKSLCKVLKVQDLVNSPTFSIVNEYRNDVSDVIYHFDFYRIDSINEAMDIGCHEYFDSDRYCFIEWPNKIEQILPEYRLNIEISQIKDQRVIQII